MEAEQHLNFVIAHSIPQSLTLSSFRSEGERDKEINDLISAISTNQWNRFPNLVSFKKISDELTYKGGIVLKGSQIVVPKKLRKPILNLAHRTHLGINKTKSLLRSKVWWPSMMSDIETIVRECKSCTLVQPPHRPEPLAVTEMPPCWSKLHVDLCGPFPDGWSILGVIDAGSRWPEVFAIKSTKTEVVTKKLFELFVNKGRPLQIVSDNGPQFISQHFKDFCKEWGIHHHRVTPLYPQANSEIERFFRTIMKTIKIAVLENKDWKEELRNFLLVYRNTPHSTTGKSPAELIYGRSIRDKLPSIEQEPTASYKNCHG